jgi:hypothetical protein
VTTAPAAATSATIPNPMRSVRSSVAMP